MEENKEFNHSLSLLAKSSIIVLISIFLSKLFIYLYRIVIARYFGPEIYGIFSLATIILSWFVTISTFGLNDGILRFLPLYNGKGDDEKMRYLFRGVFKILAFSSFLAFIILFFSSDFISLSIFNEPRLAYFLKVFSFLIPIWALGAFFLVVLRSFERADLSSLIDFFAQNFVKLLFLIFLIFFGFSYDAVIFSYSFGILSIFILSYYFTKKKFPSIFNNNKLSNLDKKIISKEVLNYSLPLMLFSIVSVLFFWIDSLFLGYFNGPKSVGFYNAAIPIAYLLEFLPILLSQMFFPLIMKEYSKNNIENIKQLSKQVTKWILIFNLPLFILILIFPDFIISLFFGVEYVISSNVLRCLAISTFITSILYVSNPLLSMVGKSKTIMVDVIFGAVLNIILNIILIPRTNLFGLDNTVGINGAAIATMISLIIFNMILFLQAVYYSNVMPLRRKMLRILLISIFSGGCLFFIQDKINSITIFVLISLVLGFLLLYLLLILIFNSLDRNDRFIMKDLLSTFKTKFKQK